MMMKLLICYHKKDVLLKDDVLTPIHVGRALARQRMGEDDPQFKWLEENMLGDDTGDNISDKNSSYNELTAVYWAWKNYEKLGNPDYIGLMHYRRHFIFRESSDVVENVRGIDENYFKRINYNVDTIAHLMDDCDYVAHIGHVDEVYKHYKENHHIEDLELAIGILKGRHPEYASTADAYLKMSYVNLCNMFIMPRDMFFEYCSWLFDILGEFERRVDLSEKRLFISERLTGIFIEHQRKKGLRQKALSATFIQTAMRIPVAMPYTDPFRMAVTMASILKNAEPTTYVDFHILHCGEASCDEFDDFILQYKGNTVRFINVPESLNKIGISVDKFEFPRHYPVIVAELLRGVNKVLYFDEKAYFFGDIARFYLACNNDEYAVLGLALQSVGTKIAGNAYSINVARLRSHNFVLNIEYCKELDSAEVFLKYIEEQVGTFPWWLYNITNLQKDEIIYYDKPRADKRWGVWDRAMLYFCDGVEPWNNIQALYSVYWWETAFCIPSAVHFTGVSEDAFDNWYGQSLELCEARSGKCTQEQSREMYTSAEQKNRVNHEKKSGLIKRTLRYMKHHGLKQTLKKIYSKIAGK